MNKFIIVSALILSVESSAYWAPATEADVVIDRVDCNTLIKKDGNYISEEEQTYTAKNENGRNKLALQTIQFFPEAQRVEVLKAVTINGGAETLVDLKTIHERSAGGPTNGVSGVKELVIPFTNLKIGSSIRYKYKTISKKPMHPGVFAMQFIYGARDPELAGTCVLKSEKKLFYSAKDKESLLKIQEGVEKDLFTLTINLIKPANKALKDEKVPILRHDSFSQVQVTTLENWQEFASLLSERYEKVLQQTLPPVFQAIVDKAKQKKDIHQQIDTVTSELSTIMTYSGNWTSLEKMYYPRGHAEVASSKIGDCKDFATTTTAVLRSLGINASVALVGRKMPYDPSQIVSTTPIKDTLAMPSLFNHAIVRIERPDNSVFWVDPTNTTSNSRYSKDDIAGSATLNMSKTTTQLETIPYSKLEDSFVKIDKTIQIRVDEKADVKGTIKGAGAYLNPIVETAFREGEKKADEYLLNIFGSSSKDSTLKVQSKNYKSRITDSFEATVQNSGEKVLGSKDGKEYFVAALPSFLEIYFAGVSSGRTTDLYSVTKGKIESSVKVLGYDFLESESNGCIAVSPWFEVERNLIKNEKGFEVRDKILFKKEYIPVSDLIQEEYANSVSDLEGCLYSQAIRVSKIPPGKTLTQRLEGYTLKAIDALYEVKGPGVTENALKARTIALQLLEINPNNIEAKIGLIKSYRWTGYRKGTEWGPLYLQYADLMIDEILTKSPDHIPTLIVKSYYQIRLNKLDEAKKYFTKAFYASANKNFEIYNLGGYILEKMNNPKLAMNSYFRALELASSDFQRTLAYSNLGGLARDSGDLAKAEEYYTQAIKYSPGDAWLMNDVVVIALIKKSYDKAIDVGEKMLKVSVFGVGQMNLADAYAGKAQQILKENIADKSRFDIAAEFAMKGLKWNERSVSCMMALAESLQGVGLDKNDDDLLKRSSDMWIKALAYSKTDFDRQNATKGLNNLSAIQAKLRKSRMPSSPSPSK